MYTCTYVHIYLHITSICIYIYIHIYICIYVAVYVLYWHSRGHKNTRQSPRWNRGFLHVLNYALSLSAKTWLGLCPAFISFSLHHIYPKRFWERCLYCNALFAVEALLLRFVLSFVACQCLYTSWISVSADASRANVVSKTRRIAILDICCSATHSWLCSLLFARAVMRSELETVITFWRESVDKDGMYRRRSLQSHALKRGLMSLNQLSQRSVSAPELRPWSTSGNNTVCDEQPDTTLA